MDVMLLGTIIVVRLLQPANAPSPIDVTPFGIVIEFRPQQPMKEPSLIDVMLLGMFIVVRLLQPENAFSPIDVTQSGIVIVVRLLHPSKA